MARHLVPLFMLAALIIPGPMAQSTDSANVASADDGCGLILVPRRYCWRPLLRTRVIVGCCYPPLPPRLIISYRCCQPTAAQPAPNLASPQPTPAADEGDLSQPPQQPPAESADPDDPDAAADPDTPADPDAADDPDATNQPAAPDLSPPEKPEPVTIDVHLPAEALLTLNGKPTSAGGSHRQVVTQLAAGQLVTLQATVLRNGERIVQLRQLRIAAGDRPRVDFDLLSSGDITTTLTLQVPADARVLLQGQPTQASGPQRVFRTTRLTSGESWENYVIEVQQQRDGWLTISRRTITLVGGRNQQLVFTGDSSRIAQQR